MASPTRAFPFAGVDVNEAEWREMAQHWRADGVLTRAGLKVTPSSGMVLAVAAGAVIIQGHYAAWDATSAVTISAADGSNPRIDLVVARLSATGNTITTEVRTGTAAASPTVPTLTQDSDTWEVELARVYVAAAVSTITAPAITDTRTVIPATRPTARNIVHNPSGAVAQRGAVRSVGAAVVYSLDRWKSYRAGSVAGMTVSQIVLSSDSSGDVTCMRIQRDSGNSSAALLRHEQSFRTRDSSRYAGRLLTVSFVARKLADFSATDSLLVVDLVSGTGTDETSPSSFTGATSVISTSFALSTSFQRFTVTGTPGAAITQLGLLFSATPTGTAGSLDAYEIKDIQIDEGGVAHPHVARLYDDELAICQRFFWKAGGAGTDVLGSGVVASSTSAEIFVTHPVPMRAAPTLSVSGTIKVYDGTADEVATVVALSAASTTAMAQVNCTVASGLTAGRAAKLYGSISSDFLWFSAEI